MRLAQAIAITAHRLDTPVVNKTTQSHGLDVTIEHPKGTLRVLHDDKGNEVYKQHMFHSYGYINKTKGRDGDEVDVFLGPLKNAPNVYIVHMLDKGPVAKEREDEDKTFLGFPGADAAKAAFLAHYPKNFFGGMTELPLATFKQKLKTATLPYRHKMLHAAVSKQDVCPDCGGKKYSLMPTDFETAKCDACGKTWKAAHPVFP